MNTRRLNVKRLKKVCPLIAQGLKKSEVIKKVKMHDTQYYRYKYTYCEKYSDLLQ